MTDFALLDVALGVIFAILTFSLIASALQEALASALNWRGRMLRRGLFRLLEGATDHGPKLVSATWLTPERVEQARLTVSFLENPNIRALYGPESALNRLFGRIAGGRAGDGSAPPTVKAGLEALGRMPSSIPKDTFARALIDTLLADAKLAYSEIDIADGITPKEVEGAVLQTRQLLGKWAEEADQVVSHAKGTVARLPMDDQMKQRLLRTLREVSLSRALQGKLDTLDGAADRVRAVITGRIDQAQATIDETMLAIGAWFDTTMDRVTGWYVRRTKWMLFLLGFLMAGVVNFDVIGYGDQLLNDEGLRKRIATQAEAAVIAEAVGELTVERAGPKALAVLILNTDRDSAISAEELAAGLALPTEGTAGGSALGPNLRAALGLPTDPAADVTDQQRSEALVVLNRTLADMPGAAPIDADQDNTISQDEADRAIDAFAANLREELGISLGELQSQFADKGVEMGWTCPAGSTWWACLAGQNWLPSVASWLIIGLGCTLGGQFWFDLLRQAVKVKTAASGLNSDLKRLSGARGGQAQGSG